MKNNFAFFGSSLFSVYCLDELKSLNILPALIITTPDKPTGRGLKLTPTPVKVWALANNIDCLTPEKVRDSDFTLKLSTFNFQLFLVASYGKIIPKEILDLPEHGVLNIHPSLLPKYRGPSPLQEQILNDEKNIGVTIIKMDEQVDHGPIIASQNISLNSPFPPKLDELKKITAKAGTELLAKILPDWIDGKIKPNEQNHAEATFTKKVEKPDGLIDIVNGDPYKNFLKIQAYHLWPRAYFMQKVKDRDVRVVITDADFQDNILIIKKVIPEGKKEMPYQDFLRGLR
jgi:methionyl-tRNA formyltransferase